MVGGELEPPLLAAALEYLNGAIIQFNTKLFECNKIWRTQLTVTNGVATLPAAFFKEHECALVGADGGRIRQLQYMDWAEHEHTFGFSDQFGSEAFTGTIYYTLFNVYGEGKLRLLPFPTNPTGVNTQYVAISYYRRFPLLAGDGDVLDAPQEIQRALVLKAQAEMLRTHAPTNPSVGLLHGLADEAWTQFGIIDRMHKDMKPRFRLAPLTTRGWYPGFGGG